jgi:hypothetical protein
VACGSRKEHRGWSDKDDMDIHGIIFGSLFVMIFPSFVRYIL